MGRLFLLGCCAFLATGQARDLVSSRPDFRKAAWGMTRAQVLATETAKPSEVRESSGEWIVRYDSIRLGELACRVVYIFANDKLVRAKYVFEAEHSDPNDFIGDFRTVESLLHETYGKPISERAFWQDDLYQDEPRSYLEQDRASAADILPSDRFVGVSVSQGHLKLYTQWRADRTKILHGLTGADDHITHQIEFLSVDLERFEGEVRRSGARGN
jgi:hypothetical protein